IPDLLGGPDTLMLGKGLWEEFFTNRDWPVAAALAVALLALLGAPMALTRRFLAGASPSGSGFPPGPSSPSPSATPSPPDPAPARGYAFLYGPIAWLIAYSFNASRLVTVWAGFSTRWYGEVARNDAIRAAAFTSLEVAVSAATLATLLGTAAGFALARYRRFR